MMKMIIRNYDDKDKTNFVNFYNFISKQLKAGTISEEDLKIYFQDPQFDPYKNMFVAYKENKLIGYSNIYFDFKNDIKRIESRLIVHPKHRRVGVGTKLLDTLLNRCNELDIEIIDIFAPKDTKAARVFAKKNGFKIERYFFTMRNENLKNIKEIKVQQGIKLDKFSLNRYLIKELVNIENLTFKNHWEFTKASEDDWERQMKFSFFLEEGITFAKEGKKIVGFSYSNFDEKDIKRRGERVGFVATLGVKESYRRRGIGKALLLSSLKFLKDHNIEIAEIGVDVKNPNKAIHLYKSVGFKEKRREICFRRCLI